MRSFVYQNLSIIKIITRNRTSHCRIRLIKRVSNFKDCIGIAIKLFEIKYNLMKKMFDLIFVF
jgi:hypothetical protein